MKRWNTFWHKKVSPHGFAILRVSFGIFLIVYWSTYVLRVPSLFSETGLVVSRYPTIENGLLQFLLTPPSVSLAYILYGIFLLCIVGILVGYPLRLAGTGVLLFLAYYYALSFYNFPSTYNRLIFLSTILLTFGGSDKTYSIASRLKGGSFAHSTQIPIWPLRLLAIQICFTYFGAGIQKFFLPGWNGGEMLSFAFIGRWATPLAFDLIRLNLPMWFYDALVYFTKLMHLTLPIGLWIPKYQKCFILLASSFHIFVSLLLGMWWFLVMIPMYIVFLDQEKVRVWIEEKMKS